VSAARALRSLLAEPEILLLPGAFDALTARVIEQAGFKAVYATGAGFANAAFGFPDIGLVTMTEAVENVRRIADAVEIPVIADADTGFGDLLQVQRAVREFERAGAAAIQLEDQVAPKRCGHFDGQRVIPAADMMRKIAIAADSRRNHDLVLIARTDARGVDGFEAAVERARAYAAAGADVIFVEALLSDEELRELPRRVGVPLLANVVEGGKTPVLTAAELQAAGYSIALFANVALRASMAATARAMEVLRTDGGTHTTTDLLIAWPERQRVVGLADYQAMEDRYAHVITIEPGARSNHVPGRVLPCA
jgi:carboxyvinyl-carboxyphosphonate phosphorylmutase